MEEEMRASQREGWKERGGEWETEKGRENEE